MSSSCYFGSNSDNYIIERANVVDWGTSDWTIAIWFYSEVGTSNRGIFAWSDDFNQPLGFSWASGGNPNKICSLWENSSSPFGTGLIALYGSTPTETEWWFSAVTHTQSSKTIELYDGKTTSTFASRASATYTTASSKTQNFRLGELALTIGWNWYGDLAHAHNYSRALSLNELKEIMIHPGSITSGLEIYWPLYNDTTPTPDLSGNGNTGTVDAGIVNSNRGPPTSNKRL